MRTASCEVVGSRSKAMIRLPRGVGVRVVADVVERTAASVRGWGSRGLVSVRAGRAGGLGVSLLIAWQCGGALDVLSRPCRGREYPPVSGAWPARPSGSGAVSAWSTGRAPPVASCRAWRACRSTGPGWGVFSGLCKPSLKD